MKVRQDITTQFSTFVQFTNDRFSHWAVSLRLRKSMQQHLSQREAAGEGQSHEDFWALYWYRSWQNQPEPLLDERLNERLNERWQGLAAEHLSAYLQETCYWASQRMTANQAAYPLSDCFQLAIAALPKVLKGYRSNQASLKTYATLGFNSAIRDYLRQQQAISSRTDWGLLRKVSQKCLTEALQMTGLSEEMIGCYRLAWSCFKTVYMPDKANTRQLAAPESATWEAIAQLYNRQRSRLEAADSKVAHSETISAETISAETLERWLKQTAKSIRAYLSPQTTSLNIQKFDDGSSELQEDLPDRAEIPMVALIAQEELQERQAQKSQVSQVLMAALEKLDPQVQTLLDLYYRQGLTQQQMAKQLDLKQYTISRRLSSTKEALLLAIVRWSQETLHITLTSPAVQQMSLVLEEWLQAQYQVKDQVQDQPESRSAEERVT